MKIAHLTTVDMSLRYLLWTQIEAAMAAGHEVIAISAPGLDVPWLEERGMRHVPLHHSTRSMDLVADLRSAVELCKVLRRERVDVLHTHNPKPGVYGRIVGRLCSVPLIVNTTHGLYAAPEDALVKRAVVYAIEAVASRFSHVELVQNPEDLEVMKRFRLVPRRKLRLLGNGVDLVRFRTGLLTSDERIQGRSDLGFDDGDVVVGTVGRLVVEKGYRELFAAMDRLPPQYRLLVVGGHDPEKADSLQHTDVERARQRGAVFVGHREDVERLYGLMDVFVLASHREGFPRAAMEASACGIPVVATDIRGCRQVVDDGVTGHLVPPGDLEALAAAIKQSAAGIDPRLPRARAEESFDSDEVSRRVLAAYARVGAPRTNDGSSSSGGRSVRP